MRQGMLVLAVLLASCVGCGGAAGRVSVSGTVKLDGKPLERGMISFIPLGGGPSAGGTIDRGSFVISGDRGPFPGRYRIEIMAFETTGSTMEDEDRAGETQEVLRQVIPSRYNVDSTLEAELAPAGPNQLSFALTSSPT